MAGPLPHLEPPDKAGPQNPCVLELKVLWSVCWPEEGGPESHGTWGSGQAPNPVFPPEPHPGGSATSAFPLLTASPVALCSNPGGTVSRLSCHLLPPGTAFHLVPRQVSGAGAAKVQTGGRRSSRQGPWRGRVSQLRLRRVFVGRRLCAGQAAYPGRENGPMKNASRQPGMGRERKVRLPRGQPLPCPCHLIFRRAGGEVNWTQQVGPHSPRGF